MGMMALRIIQREQLLSVLEGWSLLSQGHQGHPECTVRLQEKGRILDAMRKTEELLCQRTGRLQFRPHMIKLPQSSECREELRSLSYLLAQRSRTGVGAPDL